MYKFFIQASKLYYAVAQTKLWLKGESINTFWSMNTSQLLIYGSNRVFILVSTIWPLRWPEQQIQLYGFLCCLIETVLTKQTDKLRQHSIYLILLNPVTEEIG